MHHVVAFSFVITEAGAQRPVYKHEFHLFVTTDGLKLHLHEAQNAVDVNVTALIGGDYSRMPIDKFHFITENILSRSAGTFKQFVLYRHRRRQL